MQTVKLFANEAVAHTEPATVLIASEPTVMFGCAIASLVVKRVVGFASVTAAPGAGVVATIVIVVVGDEAVDSTVVDDVS